MMLHSQCSTYPESSRKVWSNKINKKTVQCVKLVSPGNFWLKSFSKESLWFPWNSQWYYYINFCGSIVNWPWNHHKTQRIQMKFHFPLLRNFHQFLTILSLFLSNPINFTPFFQIIKFYRFWQCLHNFWQL